MDKHLPLSPEEIKALRGMIEVQKKQGATLKEYGERLGKLERSDVKQDRRLQDIEEEYPLDPCMADDISKAVKRKGVEVLGGKKSGAYKDSSIRTKVYQDIYGVMKREYGLITEDGYQDSYKRLKKKYFKGALNIISEYEPPMVLANEILAMNEAAELDEDDD